MSAPATLSRGLTGRAESWAVGATLVLVATAFAVCLVPALRHWMILPVTACGVLVAPDVADWARKRTDVFDPQAVVALAVLHFFYTAPVLHVALDDWPPDVPPADDWRVALGHMAVVNVAGLLLYRMVLARPSARPRLLLAGVDRRRLLFVGAVALSVSVGTFVLFGGTALDRDLAGQGVTVLVSSSFPLLAFVLALVAWRDTFRWRPSLLVLALLVFVAVLVVADGLQGSRSAVSWPLLIALGMCHLLVARVRRRVVIVSVLGILTCVYGFGFVTGGLSSSTGRDVPGLLLGHLGHADIQALVLDRVGADASPLAHGATYLGDAASFLPGDPPVVGKIQAGTDMLYGAGSYDAGITSSRVYGLTGEAMLNFGPLGAIAVFLPFAWLVRRARAYHRHARGHDGNLGMRVLAPALPVALVVVLTADLDNTIWFTANNMAVIAVALLLSRRRAVDTPERDMPLVRQ